MADCFVSRCAHERRFFRKEFQRWSKNVLFLVGLERVAEELAGVKKWKRLMEPFTVLESKKIEDWMPEEVCCFCNNKKRPPYDPASGVVHPPVEALTVDTEDYACTYEQDPSPVASVPSPSRASSPWHDPHHPPPHNTSPSPTTISTLLDQPLDLSLGTRKRPDGTDLFGNVGCRRQQEAQGLDAHSVTRDASDGVFRIAGPGNNGLDAVLKVPRVSIKTNAQKRRYDPNCKRSYTEEELQAALRDIQSGKLGTRRAAVIYGIPRSTLRNKVYKMALEKRRGARTTQQQEKAPSAGGTKNCKEDEVDEGGGGEETPSSAGGSLRQLLKHTITQRRDVDRVDHNHWPTPSEAVHMFSDAGPPSLVPLLSQVFSNIQHLALARCRGASGPLVSHKQVADAKSEAKLPLVLELIRRLAEERLEEECGRRAMANGRPHDETAPDPFILGSALPSVILKVPSYRPAGEGPSSSSQAGGSSGTLKKVDGEGDSTSESSDVSLSLVAAETKGSSPPEKRTRPKRGRYRNYDRDNLAEAVRAVQRGEMSVHRAGNYYGVPHSTLEYKVKERHLLRPRKREERKGEQPQVNGSGSLWQGVPFLPLDFSQVGPNSFFASNMMRRLQEEAQRKQGGEQGGHSEANLFENLIKSTLEKSAAAVMPSTTEDRPQHTSLSLLISEAQEAKKRGAADDK